MVTVADLIRYRLQHERYLHRVAEGVLDTVHGEFRMIAYENEADGGESHIALTMGDLAGDGPIPVRVHTHSLAEDVFGVLGSDNRAVIDDSLRVIAEAGRGAFLYLHNGTRGFAIDRTVQPHRILLARDQRARERGGAGRGPVDTDVAPGGFGRADSFRPGDQKDLPADEYTDACTGVAGFWSGDRGAGSGGKSLQAGNGSDSQVIGIQRAVTTMVSWTECVSTGALVELATTLNR